MSRHYRIGIAVTGAICVVVAISADNWQALRNDGLHDPSNPAIKLLQEPEEALSVLRPDTAGNKVDWVKALQEGEISPRINVHGDGVQRILEQDIIMTFTLPLPYVTFSHKPHSEWMSCETCHEALFVSQVGANDISMASILNGDHCGRCHGAVAFPMTECNRCHNVSMTDR